MKNIQTEIIINAPAHKVWGILTNFEQYPGWNPFILSIEGAPQPGQRIKATLKNGNGTSVFKPVVLTAEPNRLFEWLGSLPIPGLFNGQHRFEIEELEPNRVKFIHSEQFSGLLSGLILSLIGEQTRAGFIAMNRALKARAEETAQQ